MTTQGILWFDREACLSAFAVEITHYVDLPENSCILDLKLVPDYEKNYPFMVLRDAKSIMLLDVNSGKLECILESEVIVSVTEHSRK